MKIKNVTNITMANDVRGFNWYWISPVVYFSNLENCIKGKTIFTIFTRVKRLTTAKSALTAKMNCMRIFNFTFSSKYNKKKIAVL